MRVIRHIVVHCTATSQTATVGAIQRYWREELGWKSPGYHRIIQADGTVITLASDAAICNGVGGHNAHALHVSYIGGVNGKGQPVDTRTPAQRAALERIVKEWKRLHPAAQVLGHRDFPGVTKACPSFDTRAWWRTISQV